MLQYTPSTSRGAWSAKWQDRPWLIIDGRRGNRRLQRPLCPPMASVESFALHGSGLPPELPLPKASAPRQCLRNEEVSWFVSDVQDCFHRLMIPAVLARLHCSKPVRCECLGLVGQICDGVELQREAMHVHPCPRSLPFRLLVVSCHISGHQPPSDSRPSRPAELLWFPDGFPLSGGSPLLGI